MKIEISDTQKVKKIIIEFDDETIENSSDEVIEISPKPSKSEKHSKPSKSEKPEKVSNVENIEENQSDFIDFSNSSDMKVSKEVIQKPDIKDIDNREPKVSSTMQNLNI